MLVIFPGNIPYNSDFSFGKNGLELGYPKHLAKSTNHRIQIVFCPDKQTQIQIQNKQQQETMKSTKQQKQSSKTKTNTTLYKIPETTFQYLNRILLNQDEQEMENNTIDNEDPYYDDNDNITITSENDNKLPFDKVNNVL